MHNCSRAKSSKQKDCVEINARECTGLASTGAWPSHKLSNREDTTGLELVLATSLKQPVTFLMMC